MFDIGFKNDQIVTHDELCKRAGCGCMGGIRYSSKNNVVILFMKANSQYDNSWEGDTLLYMGAGKGNQSVNSKSNIRIAEAKKNDTAICLFEWVDSINCKYVGRMILAKQPYYETRRNKYGEKEQKVIFPLKMSS